MMQLTTDEHFPKNFQFFKYLKNKLVYLFSFKVRLENRHEQTVFTAVEYL